MSSVTLFYMKSDSIISWLVRLCPRYTERWQLMSLMSPDPPASHTAASLPCFFSLICCEGSSFQQNSLPFKRGQTTDSTVIDMLSTQMLLVILMKHTSCNMKMSEQKGQKMHMVEYSSHFCKEEISIWKQFPAFSQCVCRYLSGLDPVLVLYFETLSCVLTIFTVAIK